MRSTLRRRYDSRDEIERWMGAGPHRSLPRGHFPPPPYPPRTPEIADGVHELTWRVVQALLPAEGVPV
jgi:hypothetical protein